MAMTGGDMNESRIWELTRLLRRERTSLMLRSVEEVRSVDCTETRLGTPFNVLAGSAMVTCCSDVLRLTTLAGGENGLLMMLPLRGVAGTDASGVLKGSGRLSSTSDMDALRSMKKRGLGGLRGGSLLEPVSGGAADPEKEDVEEAEDEAVDGGDGIAGGGRVRTG